MRRNTPVFRSRKLQSWNDIHDLAKEGWFFRGQSDLGLPLQSTLERCCDKEGIPARNRHKFEAELIRQFRRAYHHYSMVIPRPEAHLEWLSLMQHHGTPTRLLDFTYSIYVAAYFALEKADEDCVVWAVDWRWAADEAKRLFKLGGKTEVEAITKRWQENEEADVMRIILSTSPVRTLCPIAPVSLNQRLAIQKGVFLAPGDVGSSFVENLKAMRAHSTHVTRIIIPMSLRKKALERLYYMGISHASMFPGLDGYSRSLTVWHPVFTDEEFTQ